MASDLEILQYMRLDSRIKLTDLSRKLGLPVSTLYHKLKHSDIGIKTNTCLLDYKKLGFPINMILFVKVKKDSQEDFTNYAQKHFNVNSVFKINNGFNFFLEGVFEGLGQSIEFIEDMYERFKIEKDQTFYITDEITKEKFMTNPFAPRVL